MRRLMVVTSERLRGERTIQLLGESGGTVVEMVAPDDAPFQRHLHLDALIISAPLDRHHKASKLGELCRRASANPKVGIVVHDAVSMGSRARIFEAVAEGAHGYVFDPGLIPPAVEASIAGDSYLDQQALEGLLSLVRYAYGDLAVTLTPTERLLCPLLESELPRATIASLIHRDLATVRSHVTRLRAKLKADPFEPLSAPLRRHWLRRHESL